MSGGAAVRGRGAAWRRGRARNGLVIWWWPWLVATEKKWGAPLAHGRSRAHPAAMRSISNPTVSALNGSAFTQTNTARLPQIGFHAHPLSAFSAQFATTQPRLPRQLSDRATEVPRGLISYGRRHRSPSCRAGRRSAGAPRSGRQEEEDVRLRRPVSNVQQPSRKVDVAAVGAEGCCREALPAGDRVAARQLHLRST